MSLLDQLSDAVTLHVITLVPTPVPSLPTGTDADVQTIVNWVAGLGGIACLVGLIIVGAKMAISHRRNEDMEFSGLGKVCVAGIVIAAAAPIVTTFVG